MTIASPAATRSLEALLQAPAIKGEARGGLPESLRSRYGSDLRLPLRHDRPTVIANFVTTLDGVVSYQTPDALGGGEISGFFEPDRFVMGLLRSLADVVLVGAGTLRAAPQHRWTPSHVSRANADAFAELRRNLRLTPQPRTAVVTASGEIDLGHPGLSDPDVAVLLITTSGGATQVDRGHLADHVEIAIAGDEHVEPAAIIDLLAARGARVVLSEGGPHLIGQLLSAGLLDELFLTIAPQVAGRSADHARLGLVEGAAFGVATAPWFDLVDLRRDGDHLFSRYRIRRQASENA
jgi:riboflavin biosynthesis pyrimidine reductase